MVTFKGSHVKSLICSAALALILFPSMGSAQDYEAGLAASKAGDYATALREFAPLAEQGDVKAQKELGAMYALGWGVPQDFAEAAKWGRRAAEQGDAAAQGDLGFMYSVGQGVPHDYAEAVKWWRLAAEQAYPLWMDNLASAYQNGKGVPQDYVTAYVWFSIAVANGNSFAKVPWDKLTVIMTPADISEAQRRATVCMASNYRECD